MAFSANLTLVYLTSFWYPQVQFQLYGCYFGAHHFGLWIFFPTRLEKLEIMGSIQNNSQVSSETFKTALKYH
jgi:hypothetical protein